MGQKLNLKSALCTKTKSKIRHTKDPADVELIPYKFYPSIHDMYSENHALLWYSMDGSKTCFKRMLDQTKCVTKSS